MLFGGLYTDLTENTIYIMKDFINVALPASLSPPSSPAYLKRLEWGPAWRFDHTMVVAPSIPHPDPRHSHRTLTNAPLLYGGGGGMEIFADTWVYDHDEGSWFAVSGKYRRNSGRQSLVTSVLFGTLGFFLSACVIVCVFMKRVASTRGGRRYGGNNQWTTQALGTNGNGPPPARARRGAPAELVAGLPRVLWSDVVKTAHGCGVCGEAPASAAAPAGSSDKLAQAEEDGGGSAAAGNNTGGGEDDEREVCAVCLCQYEDDDVLLRLPCEHVFHEPCIARWLSQDSSCPGCRFNLLTHYDAQARPQPRDADEEESGGEENGVEMQGRPIGQPSSQPPATPPPRDATEV